MEKRGRQAVPAELQEQRQEDGSGPCTFRAREEFGVAEHKGQGAVAFVF